MLLTHVGDGFYNCTTCGKQYKKDNGYTILLNHLRRNHEDYKQDAQEAARRLNSLNLHLVSQRTQDLYRWIVWVVCDRLPFAFVKRRLTRLNVALSTISEDTLLRYIVLLFEVVDVRAARELPDCAGGNTGTTGDCAASEYEDLESLSRRFLLLAFSPVEMEEHLSTQSQYDLITDTLSRYNKLRSAVKFTVGDSRSENQYIGRKEGTIPLIGCASHRFNLEVKDFLKSEGELITDVQASYNQGPSYSTTRLPSVTSAAERHHMVEHVVGCCGKPQLVIIQLDHDRLDEHEVQPLLLRCAEHERVKALFQDLAALEAVTQELQKPTLTLSAARRLFDQVTKQYPALEPRLSTTATIVNNPNLEHGLVKDTAQRGANRF
ncbi:hypothetical protein PC116_g27217 [Phytophthora cactorum]|uniref:Uncharacterized protein n=1 Tax=Phytophthora cactorum TaxID=29920 RepID=A0A8T1JMK8_9STRA|nr:hypothetical protein Pcac1_g1975 [Phytophthora cactorum]KAG2959596.1 hypothetical protein PC118_g22941 [Phytophthora cactorum]KAG3042785.1 hypothetical protein PC121_g22959 [Phytophthora cactorum]KAG3125748.1 hypothetical protein C6341_g25651 [Phytophthora cactorum]KAG4224328.1 hypothetical protein PC116_g27217 [Phytophthora cactorum]